MLNIKAWALYLQYSYNASAIERIASTEYYAPMIMAPLSKI